MTYDACSGLCSITITITIAVTMPLHTPGLVLCPTELVKCRLQAARQMGVTGAGVIGTVRCSRYF